MKQEVKQPSGRTHIVDFKANRPSKIAPLVIDKFIADDGMEMYVLDNGNSQPKLSYEKFWGAPKGVILPKNFKGNTLDGRYIR